MKKLTLLFSSMAMLALMLNTSVKAQELPIDPGQAVVIIDETTPGQLETVINGDIDAEGNRVNPNRIYMLKAGVTYVQVGPIQFGGDTDNEAVLNLVGEEGGAKAMILANPGADGGAFQNIINGSLTVKNIYYGGTNLNGESTTIFSVRGPSQRIVADGFMVENMFGGAVFSASSVPGELDLFIKNCYFRDNSQLANSWNHSIIVRGDNGEPFDTLWVENTTVNFSSMPYFGKMTPVNFFFFNHNICMNGAKYPIWFERYQEAYITNNMFINSNFEGECKSTYSTQIAEDFIPGGLINLDTVEANWFDPSVAMEDVIFYAADNLNYTSEYLDKYWEGGYNTVADHPISNRVWGEVTNDELPLEVLPVPLYNERILGLAADYENVKIERSHENVNPEMVTKGIANQNVANQFAIFARQNYGVAEVGEVHDKSLMYFGDADPATIPGGGTENGYSITDMTDLPEDFSYTADIVSGIDGLPLGSLAWYPDLFCNYDSDDQLQRAKDAYNGIINDAPSCGGGTGISNSVAKSTLAIYPNPATSQFSVGADAASLIVYNTIGQRVMVVDNYVSGTVISTASLNKGMYIVSNGESMQKLVVE